MILIRPTTSTSTSSWGVRCITFAFTLFVALAFALTLGAGIAKAATSTVTNTNESGAGSLRQAITEANANSNPSEVDIINFAIPANDPGCVAASGVCTIAPTTALPDVVQAVSIRGYTQRGASANTLATGSNAKLKIRLSGENAGGEADGIRITGPDSAVKGLIINRWSDDGVEVNGADANGNSIEGNFIGTDATGAKAVGNISDGVEIADAPGNVVGGTSAAARNVIPANGVAGVRVSGAGASGNTIQGNYIGTDASGTQALGNVSDGVKISRAPNNVVGGKDAGARNVISANNGGISISGYEGYEEGGEAGGNRIEGNYIGTDVSGTKALGNSFGVRIYRAPDNVVGGTDVGARNVISANNGPGIIVSDINNIEYPKVTIGNRIEGNYIGTGASGIQALGNDSGVSTYLAQNTVVGGTSVAASNVISNNRGIGISVTASSTSILRNSIFDNASLGIDLVTYTFDRQGNLTVYKYGPTPNTPQGFQNYPSITSTTTSGSQTTIQGTLNSTPNRSFTLQFYSSPTADPSGYGEGKTYLGQTEVDTDGGGNAAFAFTTDAPVDVQHVVAATATDNVTGRTSEFSSQTAGDGTPPTVVSTNPPNGSTGVVVPGTNVSATFSEPMKASTINNTTFKLFKRVGTTDTRVAAVVSYDAANRRAILNPNANLIPGARYVAQVATGAKDLSGMGLVKRKEFTFTVRR